MANPFQKKAQIRKIYYFVAIVVLFSGALLHRRLIVEPLAQSLQLRETARGEVELTGSAVRLLMTGSRGLATTILWSAAIESQKKHEWNEVEILVGSITKLQPNFITPWMFQSWNLAFNVSVECDRPRDKYYYVTRGLDLLAEGERRNQGSGIFPGHPEIRQTIGVFYLRKIGLSDEKTTMRCLLDLSCIDPLKRNPVWLKEPGAKGERREAFNALELARFCQDNPRLVRRLREGLEYSSEKQIVDFLEKNRDVPNRFEAPDWPRLPARPPEQRQSKLKEPAEQFPVLPPAKEGIATKPLNYDLSSESNDVFLMARSWVEYSMEPLPPPDSDEQAQKEQVKKRKDVRLPRQMAQVLFRGYPARCQAYLAEGLEEEGWFDEEGWVVKKWFDQGGEAVFRVGTERKYHAQPAWDRAANLYYEYGRANDMLFTPEAEAEMDAAAEPYRQKYKLKAGDAGDLRSDDQKELRASYKAHHRPIWNMQNRGMSNFDNHYWSALAERTRDCVTARKLLHLTETYRKIDFNPELGLETFEQVWPFWTNVFLQNPKFASQSMVQEDIYEYLIKSIRLTQNQRSGVLRPVVAGAAQMALWPYPPFEILMDQRDKVRVFPIRNVRGVLDWIQIPSQFSKLSDQDLQATRLFLAVWPAAPGGYPALLQSPPVWNLMLTRTRMRDDSPPPGWGNLFDEENIQIIRDRLGVNKK